MKSPAAISIGYYLDFTSEKRAYDQKICVSARARNHPTSATTAVIFDAQALPGTLQEAEKILREDFIERL
jgi:hypothetical protein